MKVDKSQNELLSLLESALPNVSRETIEQLLKYTNLIVEWSPHINLSGTKNIHDFLFDHIVDCSMALEAVPVFSCLVDVGTGAGLPGIVWAILRPAIQFYLVESSQKRVAFLHRAVSFLNLSNIEILHSRLEGLSDQKISKLNRREMFCVSRGTTSPEKLINLALSTKLEWEVWIVFSSEKTSKEFLTLSSRFGIRAETIKYLINDKEKGFKNRKLITLKKNDHTLQ